ncbi:peptidoglycan-binding protein [Desulfotruncus alcoholivorax]|uniref:peptidoglycan-binding protein n=1 Tax=Desulfotruncus alcoholivorax TaxID=265477 RepID=UPI0004296730|nr:peptidoglycan-binding protein [Desulfotruncus alcoholivorax]
MLNTIRRGSRGQDVANLQTYLNELGYNPGRVDGIFGPATEAAVKKYQAAHRLVVDGIVGPNTWLVILNGTPKMYSGPEPVYYSQVDQRWKNIMFSSHNDPRQTIGSSGCGPTSIAMILATWINRSITPVQACQMALEGGFRTYNSGTAWSFFPWVASKFGLHFLQTASTKTVIDAINKGSLVVASMGPGYFTRSGHYIMLWDVRDNLIICHDPANKSRDQASFDVFNQQAAQYFCFNK